MPLSKGPGREAVERDLLYLQARGAYNVRHQCRNKQESANGRAMSSMGQMMRGFECRKLKAFQDSPEILRQGRAGDAYLYAVAIEYRLLVR